MKVIVKLSGQFIEGERVCLKFIQSFLCYLSSVSSLVLHSENKEGVEGEIFVRTLKKSIRLIRQMHILLESFSLYFRQDHPKENLSLSFDPEESREIPIHLKELSLILKKSSHIAEEDKQFCQSIINQILSYYPPWDEGGKLSMVEEDPDLQLHGSVSNNIEEGVL